MTWNHRVVKFVTSYEAYYAIVECFYNSKNEIVGYDSEPRITGDSLEELRETLSMMQECVSDVVLDNYPIIDNTTVNFGSWDE